jgi:hypothetical protein
MNAIHPGNGRRMRFRFRREYLFAIVSTVMSLLGAEVYLRYVYPCPVLGYVLETPLTYFYQYDPKLGWRGRAGVRGRFSGRDFHVSVTHDPDGRRTTARPYIQGKKNILILGDSFGWGWGVQDDQIISECMMRISDDLNVYNLSASGYGTDQEYLDFVEHTVRYPEFDAVVVLFCENDLVDIGHKIRFGNPKPQFILSGDDLVLTNVPVPETKVEEYDSPRSVERRTGRFLHLFHIYNLIQGRQADSNSDTGKKGKLIQRLESYRDFIVENHCLEIESILLNRLKAACDARDASFLVVYVRPYTTWESKELGKIMDASGIRHITFTGRKYFRRTDLWLDPHWNAFGHAAAAKQVVRELDADNEYRTPNNK